MITIKNRFNHRIIEQIDNNDYFKIDKNFIYIKDEFDNIIKFDRRIFYSEMGLNLEVLKSIKRGFIKNLPKGIKLNYSNTI